jgi:ketosteroid isomerase-like protein
VTSQESVQAIVERSIRAWVERDVDGLVECFHPEAELLLPRNVLEGGSYRGLAGVRQAFADACATWAAFGFEHDETRVFDGGALVLGQTTNVGKGDAPTITYQSAYLMRLREGRITYWRPYQDHREALEAAGLAE